ncbi:MAG: class F sortase [Dehalococcoidia bacterium]|nr:class F sortase [Dehalococcoidia bacterium]
MAALMVACALAAAACGSAPPAVRDSGLATVEPTSAAAVEAPATPDATPAATEEPTPAATTAPATTPVAPSAGSAATPRPATPRAAAPAVVRVRIPALGVDAPILQMGVDAAGVMEIPQSSSTVAWYGFTALPGSSGNAVMAGHVTWGGARAVFYQLQNLRPGDAIEVQTGDGGIRYAVQRTYLVRPEEADIAHIIGPRDGPQTLTLITCGGTFDSSAREYDHRVIVFATRI